MPVRIFLVCLALLSTSFAGMSAWAQSAPTEAKAATGPASATTKARPALVVETVQPAKAQVLERLAANGSIAPWQEMSIGVELGGLRLTELRADVGDRVRKGELLARLNDQTISAELAVAQAQALQAQAQLKEASENAQRARKVGDSGALSEQQAAQFLHAEALAQAQAQAAQAQVALHKLRLTQTQILAPDDGVVALRPATLGAVVAPGQELFRLHRQARMEWRAELLAAELARIRVGQAVEIDTGDGQRVKGRVRLIGPLVDAQTRNAIVHVDLAAPGALRAGMFARGEFVLSSREALTLPQQAVVVRDGFHLVFEIDAQNRALRRKVRIGQRSGDRIEILEGIGAQARIVATGAAFLNDGDLVKVLAAKP